MAHHNIYEVSFDPIPIGDRFDDCALQVEHGWFIGQIAEATRDQEGNDRSNAIQALMYAPRGYCVRADEHGEYIIVTSKEEFFRPMWERFCKEMESTVSLQKYMNYRKDYDKYGTYIYADGELMCFAEFISGCAVNEKYYLGGIVSYKC